MGSSLASSAIGASSPPIDGLSQRGILLVHGVRARRGGGWRVKAKARSSIRTHKSVVARTASSAAEQLHYTRPKKGVRSAPRAFRNGSTGGLQITPRPV